jgi:hypothetical protein
MKNRPRFKSGRYRDLRAVAHRRGLLHLHCERPAFRLPDSQSEWARAFGFTTHANHADSRIATLLLTSVAARHAWLYLWTSRLFLEQVRALTDALSFA